ncbi:hypothetical protein EMEDMD4_240093 [Sinorhizobium medicae]|uniref:Uncharacterized protein n=1 Tax=Sinorhizobium medicae TaxID=110321 RepID=A0A508WUD1_9HYPH|nr:hypothetical protein EMEDMD4_240093 [Sinorhizobium medicae]
MKFSKIRGLRESVAANITMLLVEKSTLPTEARRYPSPSPHRRAAPSQTRMISGRSGPEA